MNCNEETALRTQKKTANSLARFFNVARATVKWAYAVYGVGALLNGSADVAIPHMEGSD
jgi:hypothetical protein